MSDPYLGEIRIFAGNYAPVDWALCDGQLLQIAQYDALFSLIGTSYGGDGLNTFALPDLRGRLPIHQGGGFVTGGAGGTEQVTLTAQQLAGHTHPLMASTALATVWVSTSPSPMRALSLVAECSLRWTVRARPG